ncbi:U-box domain-containing protein [bacterium]
MKFKIHGFFKFVSCFLLLVLSIQTSSQKMSFLSIKESYQNSRDIIALRSMFEDGLISDEDFKIILNMAITTLSAEQKKADFEKHLKSFFNNFKEFYNKNIIKEEDKMRVKFDCTSLDPKWFLTEIFIGTGYYASSSATDNTLAELFEKIYWCIHTLESFKLDRKLKQAEVCMHYDFEHNSAWKILRLLQDKKYAEAEQLIRQLRQLYIGRGGILLIYPEELTDPLTRQQSRQRQRILIDKPVLAKDGAVYERSKIEEFIEQSKGATYVSPVYHKDIKKQEVNFVTDFNMKSLIDTFIEKTIKRCLYYADALIREDKIKNSKDIRRLINRAEKLYKLRPAKSEGEILENIKTGTQVDTSSFHIENSIFDSTLNYLKQQEYEKAIKYLKKQRYKFIEKLLDNPKHFVDPISFDLIREPWVLSDGTTFEGQIIDRLNTTSFLGPKTRKPIKFIWFNYTMNRIIEFYKKTTFEKCLEYISVLIHEDTEKNKDEIEELVERLEEVSTGYLKSLNIGSLKKVFEFIMKFGNGNRIKRDTLKGESKTRLPDRDKKSSKNPLKKVFKFMRKFGNRKKRDISNEVSKTQLPDRKKSEKPLLYKPDVKQINSLISCV